MEENGNNKLFVLGVRIERGCFVTVQGGKTILRFPCQVGLTVTRNMAAFWDRYRSTNLHGLIFQTRTILILLGRSQISHNAQISS